MLSCTLVIKDEVNCHFQGLDLDTRKLLSKKFKYEDPKAKYLPAVRLGRWDGSVSFFSIGGSTYLALVGEILEILDKRGYDIEVQDLRKSPALEFNKINEEYWGDRCWPAGHRFEGQPIRLRADQVDAVNVFLENPQSLQSLATGFGKCLASNTIIEVYSKNIEMYKSCREFIVSEDTYHLPIGKFADVIENICDTVLINNCELDISKLAVYAPTPSGWQLISHVIKKTQLQQASVRLSNGYVFNAALTHIVQRNGTDVFVKDLQSGDVIAHKDATVHVISVDSANVADCYDIAIPSPHVYYDANGVLHHNTILTATLCKVCEKYGRTITIVPNKSLVEQTEEDFVNCGLDVGVYYGGRKDLDKKHTICTWQSLNVLDKKNIKTDDDIEHASALTHFLENVNTVIVDECFDGNTLIETPTGQVPIKDIQVGDEVINYSESSGRYKSDRVVKVFKNLTNSKTAAMVELTLSNNTTIQVTANHKFLTSAGWCRADMLTEDMEFITTHYLASTVVTLISKKEIQKPAEVYNLHIETDHNYIANEVVVANCHTAKAKVLQTLLTTHCADAPIRWGITGTIPKLDLEFQTIRTSIGEVVNQVKAHELQEQGVLSNCHVNIVQTIEWKEFRSYPEELKYLVTNQTRVEFIGEFIQQISQNGNTLVLVDRIETGKILKAFLSTPDNEVPFVSGAVKTKDRKDEYDEIKTADNRILLATYGVAAVGINIPRIFNMVLVEPGKSFVRVIQSIGRGLRKASDKDHVEIYDISASTKYSKRHLTERKRYYREANYAYTIQKINAPVK